MSDNGMSMHNDDDGKDHPDDLPFPEATASDPDAESDPSLLDLETFCAFCGLRHSVGGNQRDCHCPRHIDGGEWLPCNSVPPDYAASPSVGAAPEGTGSASTTGGSTT